MLKSNSMFFPSLLSLTLVSVFRMPSTSCFEAYPFYEMQTSSFHLHTCIVQQNVRVQIRSVQITWLHFRVYAFVFAQCCWYA